MPTPAVSRAARLAQIKDEASYLRGQAARTLCAYGVLMQEVERDELWREDGEESFDAWLRAFQPGRVTHIRRGMRIASVFSPDDAATLGVEKCEAGVRYLAATPDVEGPGELLTAKLRIRGPKGAFATVPFLAATTAQVNAARKLVIDSTTPKPAADPQIATAQKALGKGVVITRDADRGLLARPRAGMTASELRKLASQLDKAARA
jgi:hypothetical protein